MIKKALLYFDGLVFKLNLCIRELYQVVGRWVKVRFNFLSRKFLKLEYLPIWIAFGILILTFGISSFVVVYDTNSHITTVTKMQQLFLENDYNLNKIRTKEIDVPRIFIKTLPPDFNMVESPREKKELFIKFLLPLILKKNEELRGERKKLIAINEKLKSGINLIVEEQLWLDNIKIQYKTETGNINDILVKLDEMSVPMALGQAIQETGWGESRFLIQGNAIFAEWTWGGEGMLPRSRKDGMIHRVKTFPTLYDSVESYANNLNKTRYYAGFRRMRAKLRADGKSLYGRWLMSSMVYYSTQKDVYILEVKKIIRDNSLDDFNNIKLVVDINENF